MSGAATIDIDSICSTLGQILSVRGERDAANILAVSSVELAFQEYDNYDGGVEIYRLEVRVPPAQFAAHSPEQIKRTEETYSAVLRELGINGRERIWSASVSPSITSTQDWRDGIQRALGTERVNNQGRVRSSNPAPIEVDGLRFRSMTEVNIYKALKSTGVAFAPLPVFLRGGSRYQRIEPDFVIIWGGKVLVLEVDGASHTEMPADADNRTEMLEVEGIQVRHVRADDCLTEAAAMDCVRRIMSVYRIVAQIP
ncbi:hypothetical protein [Corallococcus terminator]|uniref:hypothetical protein n=1 Tax=Corallococcus terminator TaxID=2316733 RepID=UPI0011C49DFF|nr:hypothetical protein [Corallococcus terminator]